MLRWVFGADLESVSLVDGEERRLSVGDLRIWKLVCGYEGG